MGSPKILLVFLLFTLVVANANASSFNAYSPPSYGSYYTPRGATNCNRNPAVCRAPGSAGPDCCKGQCVDFSTSSFSCGACGKRCGFSEICCAGKCVNPSSNRLHCGGCDNECKRGSYCFYGMCSYA